jgi:hypothetical protein
MLRIDTNKYPNNKIKKFIYIYCMLALLFFIYNMLTEEVVKYSNYDSFRFFRESINITITDESNLNFFIFLLNFFYNELFQINLYPLFILLIFTYIYVFLYDLRNYSLFFILSSPTLTLFFQTGKDGIYSLLLMIFLYLLKYNQGKFFDYLLFLTLLILSFLIKGVTIFFGIFVIYILYGKYFNLLLKLVLFPLLSLFLIFYMFSFPDIDAILENGNLLHILPSYLIVTVSFDYFLPIQILMRMFLYIASLVFNPVIFLYKIYFFEEYFLTIDLVNSLFFYYLLYKMRTYLPCKEIIVAALLLSCSYFFPHLRYFYPLVFIIFLSKIKDLSRK